MSLEHRQALWNRVCGYLRNTIIIKHIASHCALVQDSFDGNSAITEVNDLGSFLHHHARIQGAWATRITGYDSPKLQGSEAKLTNKEDGNDKDYMSKGTLHSKEMVVYNQKKSASGASDEKQECVDPSLPSKRILEPDNNSDRTYYYGNNSHNVVSSLSDYRNAPFIYCAVKNNTLANTFITTSQVFRLHLCLHHIIIIGKSILRNINRFRREEQESLSKRVNYYWREAARVNGRERIMPLGHMKNKDDEYRGDYSSEMNWWEATDNYDAKCDFDESNEMHNKGFDIDRYGVQRNVHDQIASGEEITSMSTDANARNKRARDRHFRKDSDERSSGTNDGNRSCDTSYARPQIFRFPRGNAVNNPPKSLLCQSFMPDDLAWDSQVEKWRLDQGRGVDDDGRRVCKI